MTFPTNAVRGDTYTAENTLFTYNGRSWDRTTVGRNNNTNYARHGLGADGHGAGGYEFTGAFVDRVGDGIVQYTAEQAAAGIWRRFGFSAATQVANDVEYWGETSSSFDQSKGLFGGLHMPDDVENLFDFTDTSFAAAQESGDLLFSAAEGSYNFKECKLQDLAKVRFSFNVTPQVANTTVEVALIWAIRDENDVVQDVFPLTAQPIFFGQETAGQTFLNRVEISAYFASDQDLNARVLPSIRANNAVLVSPITTLCSIVR